MPGSCKQCGAALKERDAFCTKCGAQRRMAVESAAQRFCRKCGSACAAGTKFCTKCGAEVGSSADSALSVTTATQNSATQAAGDHFSAQNAAQGALPSPLWAWRIPKAVVVGALAIVAVLILDGIVSAVHRAQDSAQEREAAKNREKSLKNLGSESKNSEAKGQAISSSDANLQKNLAQMQAAASALGSTSSNAVANRASSNSTVANATPAVSGKPSAPYGWTLENGKLVPAKAPKASELPKAYPIVPVAATANEPQDWGLKYERTEGGPEADLVVRTGDINNLGFGWPAGFDPFSGKSTPPHQWPDINKIPPGAPDGTDRIMLGTSVMPVHMTTQRTAGQPDQVIVDSVVKGSGPGDGYSGSLNACFLMQSDLLMQLSGGLAARLKTLPSVIPVNRPATGIMDASECTRERMLTAPAPVVLSVGALPGKINAVLFQIFADDFQPVPIRSHFQVSLNGTRIPTFEYAINALDQSGPIGKLLTLKLLPEYWPLLKAGTVKLLIDDPTTHAADGYAVDFVRILVNPHKLKYEVSLSAHVVDADKHRPITGATVTAALESASTDKLGKCELAGLPAGLVVATASAPGYDENSTPVDLPAGQKGEAEIQLHRHQESTAALEQSIAQTGSATIYGIHFDTNSSKLRPDSLPALNAVLGLIHNHSGSRWIIAGHTDNQGDAALNQPLSEARAKSVVAWLEQHGANTSRLAPEGFGATRPVADNATANGRALNRRVEVSLAN